jgi:hypothetical protein
VPVEFGRRDSEVAEIRSRGGVPFVMVTKDGLHDDRFQRGSQRGGRQRGG